jgi:succinate dehydrogenase assembly factor 1
MLAGTRVLFAGVVTGLGSSSLEAAKAEVRRRPKQLSGLQKRVLSLYRNYLRAIQAKEQLPAAQRQQIVAHVREQFDEGKTIRRLEIDRIEWLLRSGDKKLKQLKLPGFKGVGTHQ